ncbi:hypothetical protein BMS3Abin10_01923 [bacterium BMS3Abin10]|nr:hypothetical protein BMS3Abin10_01923 [bacterium BMS3Abin10]GBE38223.1 hypothetical protein BMS3Bbin08_00826 [bacterium BMS3Bbin08]HDH50812.1 hypothetical protein [Nitrospirota bacterium]
MEISEEKIRDILDSLEWLMDAHDSSAELVELKGNTAIIQLSGQCAVCDTNCIEDSLYQELPEAEFIFR